MSRGKKRTRQKRRRRRPDRDPDRDIDLVVADTAACFTCSVETAKNFAYQCAQRREDLDCDLAFNHVAHEIWAAQQDPTEPLVQALAELLAEQQRHLEMLTALGERFDALTKAEEHHHLDPPETYRALIKQRVFNEPPAAT